MLGHLNRLLKQSLVYGMSETVSRGIGFILIFLYVRVLSVDEIGIRTAVYSASIFIGMVYTLGLDNAFLRFFMDENHKDKRRQIMGTAMFFSTLLGVLVLIYVFWQGDIVSKVLTKSSSYTYIMYLIFIILIFDTIIIFPMLVLRAENKVGYFFLVSCVRFFLFIVLNIVFVWIMGRGLAGVFEANLVAVIVLAGLLSPIIFSYIGGVSLSLFKQMLIFGVPTIFTVLFVRIIDFSDRYIILYYFGDHGDEELGKYSVAYTLGLAVIMVFVNSFRLAWTPFFLSFKNNPDAKNLFSRIATYYAMFISIVFLGITLYRREIFSLYASDPNKYPVSLADIVPYVALGYIFFGFYTIMLAGIFIRDKTKYLPLATLVSAVINVSFNLMFVPKFGIIGAAYTTMISYGILALVMYAISHRIYRVNYEFRRIGIVAIMTAIPLVLSYIFTPDKAVLSFIYRGFLFSFPILYYIFSKFLLDDERNRIRQFYRTRLRTLVSG